MMQEKRQRVARFVVKRIYFQEWETLLLPMMSRLVVLEAKFRWDLDGVEYMAFSKDFPEIPIGVEAPTWTVEPEMMERNHRVETIALKLCPPPTELRNESGEVVAHVQYENRIEPSTSWPRR